MNHHIAGMPPSLSMSRGRNMYFPCGGPGVEPPPHHMQRGPCYPMPDDKMGGLPPGMLPHPGSPFPPNRMPCGMMGEFKSPMVEPPTAPVGNSKKKRRTSAAVTPQPSPVLQDLMPQQPSTLGDTIVASNPFDDTPPSMQQQHPPPAPHHMHMGGPMGMSPMHSPHHVMNPIVHPPMSSPMGMNIGMVGNPLSSPLGNMSSPMGSPHMMAGMMNGGGGGGPGPGGPPTGTGPGPAMSPMTMMNNNMVGGPMTSPMAGSPIMGSPHPMAAAAGAMNGPLGSPMNCAGATPSPNSCSMGGGVGTGGGGPTGGHAPSPFAPGGGYPGPGVNTSCGPSPGAGPTNASPFGGAGSGAVPGSFHGPTGNTANFAPCAAAAGPGGINSAVPNYTSSSPSPYLGPTGNCGSGPCGPGCGPPRNIRMMGPAGGPVGVGPPGSAPMPTQQQQQPPQHPHPHPQPQHSPQMHPQMHPAHLGGIGAAGPKPLPVSAGKIYPPDQPMVFNPQNPNAPPIYPCGICHKEVHDNDQAILCESGCNFWFHRMCTGLGEAAYQLLTAEVYAEWVCDKCLNSKNIPLVKFKP